MMTDDALSDHYFVFIIGNINVHHSTRVRVTDVSDVIVQVKIKIKKKKKSTVGPYHNPKV